MLLDPLGRPYKKGDRVITKSANTRSATELTVIEKVNQSTVAVYVTKQEHVKNKKGQWQLVEIKVRKLRKPCCTFVVEEQLKSNAEKFPEFMI